MRRRSGGISGGPSSVGSPDACASRCRSVEPSGPAGSSRSTVPSSTATSTASPVRSFVTDAHRNTTSRAPCEASVPSRRTTPAAAARAPQSSIVFSASTAGDTRGRMERRLISSGSAWEERYGYSRAVVAGQSVYVAGTAPIMPGDADPPRDPYEQARRCLEIALAALEEAGARAEDVVRTRVFVRDAAFAPEVLRAHGEVFGAVRPACTGIVAELLDPRWLVEIELEAVVE